MRTEMKKMWSVLVRGLQLLPWSTWCHVSLKLQKSDRPIRCSKKFVLFFGSLVFFSMYDSLTYTAQKWAPQRFADGTVTPKQPTILEAILPQTKDRL